MDSRAYLLPGMSEITQLSPTLVSVITLGKLSDVPLIRARSELVDGLEPHDHFYLRRHATARTGSHAGSSSHAREGVPGVGAGGYREGAIPGTNPPGHLRPV